LVFYCQRRRTLRDELLNLPRAVWLLGFVSLATDAASETIYPLLPFFLTQVLGAGAVSLGIVEGAAEAANSLLKIWSGRIADRSRRARPLVFLGYGLSSFARPLIAMTTGWAQVLSVRIADRIGKGIRGAPRDVLLASFASPTTRGKVFGFHRAMDHTGAIVGPLVATVILFFAPERYRLLFALTAIPGAIAVALLFLVDENAGGEPRTTESRTTTDHQPPATNRLPGRVIALLGVLLVFGLGNSADAFLLLRLSDALGGATYVPLLWAGIHIVKASLSTWGGELSDRFGRKQLIIAGWMIYALVYVGFALSTGAAAFIAWFLFYGVYFALAEGAEKALIADLTPMGRRGAAFGWYNAVVGVGALVASIVFGELYEHFGASVAFMAGAAFAGAAAVLLLLIPTDTIKDSNA